MITQSGGKHPLGSKEMMYLSGKHGGRGVIKVSGGRIYIDWDQSGGQAVQ